MITYNNKQYNCPLEMTMDLIDGKWKVLIMWQLSEKVGRFNELRRQFPQMTQKMLTQQLRDLENNGLIIRTVYPQVPPKVEYTLTEFGRSLIPLLRQMDDWGSEYAAGQTNQTEK
ncbi:winged helix-turn-helix transcriptional regulator [Acetanaerobacterium elongatum]|uniref:Transcriptional regulator, HxlR family n=1 Tax=Acetanaerobacterium elongatum TaxID=258515 RepID=A0A1H0F1M9_9FIRM|nr:helix-turn-helix domain-containing protein [Acetanaerobacterium elongatum]SDN88568.1 transcriptional regulator, HxlR family [Acetanaerobacterium elongatum]